MKIQTAVFMVGVMFSACGSGGNGGTGGGSGGGSGASFPETVKLQGTIEYTTRTYDHPGGTVVFSKTSNGTFSGTSTSSDLGAVLHYSFSDPFIVEGTQAAYDVTNSPKDCSKTISSSTGSNLELYVGSPTTGGYVAQLSGTVNTSSTDTCANGTSNIFTDFTLDLPNDTCPDSSIKVLSNANWLVVGGDPHTGFNFSQDITCDAAIIKITASVEGL